VRNAYNILVRKLKKRDQSRVESRCENNIKMNISEIGHWSGLNSNCSSQEGIFLSAYISASVPPDDRGLFIIVRLLSLLSKN
jgi:hypothetical protein